LRRPADGDPVALLDRHVASDGPRSVVWLTPNRVLADDLRTRLTDPGAAVVTLFDDVSMTVPTLVICGIRHGWDRVQPWIDRADRVVLVLPESEPIPECWPETYEPLAWLPAESVREPAIRHEAPTAEGESRMAARQIRTWLDLGVDAHAIVVTARSPEVIRPLLHDALADCGVPLAPGPAGAWRMRPGVAIRLKAWALPTTGFPFAAVAEVLRSSFLKSTDAEMPANGVALLRQLGRTRGKAAFLAAVEEWAISPPQPLEDEGAETPHRERLGRLAGACRPFLADFFGHWDRIPAAAAPAAWVESFGAFADGLFVEDDEATAFVEECRTRVADEPADSWIASEFAAWLTTRADRPATIDDPAVARGVRFVPAETAREIPCEALVLLDLGEGTFPTPDKSGPDDLSLERRLFRDLLGRPRRYLLLSRAATDELGQELLPSTFLDEYATNHPELPPPIRQKLLVERFAEGLALTASERRAQAARRLLANPADPLPGNDFADGFVASLLQTRTMIEQRFGLFEHSKHFTPFDGQLAEPAAVARAAALFPPERAVSPSSLETYAACPFRFWMAKVLQVDEPIEPAEDVEPSRRGQAIHRALARFHRDRVHPTVEAAFAEATGEYAARAASPFGRVLWELEGRRLARTARKYDAQWQAFRSPWQEKGIVPEPARFEQSFGNPKSSGEFAEPLVIGSGDEAIRIAGTIDRIDTAETDAGPGFWIVDYKTGSDKEYTSTKVESLEKLQLALYAMAAESIVYAGDNARPLGLIYWFPSGDGARAMVSGNARWSDATSWLANPAKWTSLRTEVRKHVLGIAADIRRGRFPLDPIDDNCTRSCPYSQACRIANSRHLEKTRTSN
jgi:RecB family exonuclease